jgi:FMN-dependent NADH-azoreductase
MPPATLLKITTSINGDHSISNGLAKTFIDTFLEKAPDTIVVERDLNKLPVAFLNVESVYGSYKPEDQRSESEKAQVGTRLELVQELLGASDVVIATPMWNWNCPAVLKAYIDAIIMPGVLGAGEGKLAGKKVTILVSQGGAYGPGTGKESWDYLSGYLKMVFSALGSTDVVVIKSELGLAGIAPGMEGLVDQKAANIAAATEEVKQRAIPAPRSRPVSAK